MAVSDPRASATETSDRELVFNRVFDAPRDLVFTVWTDPSHVGHWWGPDGFTLTIREMDVRAGGVWRFVMHGPDGVDYNNRIVFIEVDRPRRLIYKHSGEEGDEPVSFEVTVTFSEKDGKTHLNMHMLFPSKAERDHVIEKYGADEGANQTLGRLAAYLATVTQSRRHEGTKAR
jgi:uncharacterized protein YndB with AHSA1/START domain